MDNLTLSGFRAHALSATFRSRLDEARALLAEHLDGTCYVSFSAGKDSAVVAHLCHAARAGIPMLMVDPGCPTHWTEDERGAWLSYADAQGWNLTLFNWEKWEAVAGSVDEDAHRRAAHGSMFADLTAHAEENGLTTRVMGIRAEESRGRAITVRHLGAVYDYADGGRRILPIASWRWRDVWAYTVTHGLPWLTIYDHGGPRARNGLVGRSGMADGRMAFLREHYPDAWRIAREVFPEESYA